MVHFQLGKAMDDPLSPENLRRTAFHEAGHAVATVVLGRQFERVYIVIQGPLKDGDLQGSSIRNLHRPHLAGQHDLGRKEAMIAVAGPMGECFAAPGLQWNPTNGDPDFDAALSVLKFAHCDFTMNGTKATFDPSWQQKIPLMKNILDGALQEAYRLTQTNRAVIARVAEALLEKTELSFNEVVALVNTN
jgi:ATP-dependent Zn protease